MIRTLGLVVLLMSSLAQAGDTLYYVCVGEDPVIKVAALQQTIKVEGDIVSSTFVLDVAAPSDEYLTRFSQKGKLIFKNAPDVDDSLVIGTFENGTKTIAMTIFYRFNGYGMELWLDGRQITMPCRKKI